MPSDVLEIEVMAARNSPGWWSILMGFGLISLGCSSPCDEVASQLRQCCAAGPEDLRAGCEAEARRLEEDGNDEACESALDSRLFERCVK